MIPANEEDVVEVPEIVETKGDDETDTTDWKALALERQELAKKNFGIAQRYKTKLGKVKETVVEPKVEPKVEPTGSKTGELDDTQLDYLDLKGVTEEEDIAIIKNIMQKTGQTVRQALKDEYVIAKLKDLKVARDVKIATPSSTKRSDQQTTDNVDYWFQKYEASGELPKGMPAGMAIKLVDRKANQSDMRRNPFE